MAQPPAYDRQFSFIDSQASSPDDPLPANQHEIELNAIKTTLDAILANLALIQRDDGALANNSVGNDQLSSTLQVGVDTPTTWSAGQSYAVNNTVVFNTTSRSEIYLVAVAHTSANDIDDDVAAGNLTLIADWATILTNATVLKLSGGTMTGLLTLSGDATAALHAVTKQQLEASVVGQQTIFVPAGALTARSSNGAAAGSVETTTNKVMLGSLDFDASADEFAQFAVQMPKGWDEGTVVAQFVWSHPSTTTNFGVAWFIQAVALANDDAADAAFGTAVSAVDTGGTTDDVYISPETAAMTVAGSPAAEEWVVFQVYRDVSDASDDLAVDARLHGVKIHYTTDAVTDD